MKGYTQAIEQSEKDKKRGLGDGKHMSSIPKKMKKSSTVMEQQQEKGAPMPSVDCQNADALAVWKEAALEGKPVVLRKVGVTPSKGLQGEIDKFTEDFKKSELRKTVGRAARLVEDKGLEAALQALADSFPDSAVLPHDPRIQKEPVLQQVMAGAVFGLRANGLFASTEQHTLWTARLTTKGSRVVAVWNVEEPMLVRWRDDLCLETPPPKAPLAK